MWGRLGPRFALEAGFLIAVAVALGIADVRPLVIVIVMAGAWVLVSLIELVAAREPSVPLAAPPPIVAPAEPEEAVEAAASAEALAADATEAEPEAPRAEEPDIDDVTELEAAEAAPRRRRWWPSRRAEPDLEEPEAEREPAAEASEPEAEALSAEVADAPEAAVIPERVGAPEADEGEAEIAEPAPRRRRWWQ